MIPMKNQPLQTTPCAASISGAGITHGVTIKTLKISGIYCAIHRDSGMCYIGSSVDIKKRISSHINSFKYGSRARFHVAIESLGFQSFDWEILEHCGSEKLLEREKFYIALFNSASSDGFNTRIDPCATYGNIPSEQTRKIWSDQRRNPSHSTREKLRYASSRPDSLERLKKARLHQKPVTDATRLKLIQFQKSRSPESRAKASAANTGKKRSKEYCRTVSARFKGRKLTDQHKEKLRLAKRYISTETRLKIGAASRGRKHSEQSLEKMRLSNIGRKASEETLKKLRAAWVKRKAAKGEEEHTIIEITKP